MSEFGPKLDVGGGSGTVDLTSCLSSSQNMRFLNVYFFSEAYLESNHNIFSKFSHILFIRFISLLLTPSLWPWQHFPLLRFSRWLDQSYCRRRSPMRMRERQNRDNKKRRRLRHKWRRTMWEVLNEPSWSACSIGMLWLTWHLLYP